MKTKIILAIIACGLLTLSFTTRSLNNPASFTNADKKPQAANSEPVGGLAIDNKF